MTSILNLAPDLSACPSCWRNFIREYNKEWDSQTENSEIKFSQDESTKHFYDVNVELQDKWNAMLTGKDWDSNHEVAFNTDQDKLLFILRWS